MFHVQLCSICTKTFGSATALKRHTSYCRRAQHRPNPRRRSCSACNVAKIKCNFESPCLRCAKKGIDCTYKSTHLGGTPEQTFSPDPVDNYLTNAFLASDPIHALDPLLLQDDGLWHEQTPAQEIAIPYQSLNSSMSQLCKVGQPIYLTRLQAPDAVAEYAVNLVIDALCGIPMQMMRRETFPCFIHAHWGSQLPESLTTCMHLAKMYGTRSMEIRPFMWRSILAEQTRIMQQVSDSQRVESLLIGPAVKYLKGGPPCCNPSAHCIYDHASS